MRRTKRLNQLARNTAGAWAKDSTYVSGREEVEYAGTVGTTTSTYVCLREYVLLYRCAPVSPPDGISSAPQLVEPRP